MQEQWAELERRAGAAPAVPSLEAALRGDDVRIIAEVKRRSPSKGVIATGLDAADQAEAYVAGGAAAISVLTEQAHFGGKPTDLKDVRARVRVPTLKKDFHVRPVQLMEARVLGASAALLIVRALAPDRLREMMDTARAIALEALVEVRDEAELDRALECGATLIGVNNRDLETLVIDPATVERIVPRVPSQLVAVAESGITGRADVERYASCGADAVLVGSSISAAASPAQATRAIAGVPRRARGD
jgi:indole-3-glycerol phosphate synthase